MTTNTFEIESPEGEMVEIEVEELSPLERMTWAARFPGDLSSEGFNATPEIMEYLVELVEEQTVLTRELLDELNEHELSHTFNAVVVYSFDSDDSVERPSADNDEMQHDLEFNDDGSLDLDDWR